MVRVKICGNTTPAQIEMAAAAGADCVGVVVEYPDPVPWNVSCAEARQLLMQIPAFVSRAVVTGGAADSVLRIAQELRPHLVQLHTDNSCQETAWLARELALRGIGLVRALRINADDATACGEISDPLEAARALAKTGIAALLVDARTKDLPAGTGVRVSWELARSIRETIAIPMVLAGGLHPGNVAGAIAAVAPYGVDVLSGVEAARGVKDPQRVGEFVRRVREAQQ
jgi:phosphoribosylanthranilate isomerase